MADPDSFSVTTLTTVQSLLVDEHVVFSFTALCQAIGAGMPGAEVEALVAEGLLLPTGTGPDDWQFTGPSLQRARNALRLARELELSLHAAAIVMDLLAEIQTLRARR
jgi:chaperone modulatory protein CbpM